MTRLALAFLLLSSCASRGKAEVLFFITTDCPIANSFAPEINRITAEYGPRGVAFTMVYTDLSHPLDTVHRHASEYRFESPVQVDSGRVLARQHGIMVTPEAVVVADGARVYRGRIDDRYLAPGRYR